MFAAIRSALAEGALVPYIGPGVLALTGANCPIPASHEALAARLTATTSVPHKLRTNLTGAAQFIENFKHRKTVVALMETPSPQKWHRPSCTGSWPSSRRCRCWCTPGTTTCRSAGWRNELTGAWCRGSVRRSISANGRGTTAPTAPSPTTCTAWQTTRRCITRRRWRPGGRCSTSRWARSRPAANFLVSDSDFVEVLTEIDIQTPIPEAVKNIRVGRHFLFLGCRFATQLERSFAHQITKRSSDLHWAVLPETPTRNEARFLAQHGIERIPLPLATFVAELAGTEQAVAA